MPFPRLFDWYLIRRFATTLVFALAIFTVVIAVFDLVEKLDEYLRHRLSWTEVLRDYYSIFIPYFITTFLAFFAFISAIFFTSRMAYASELIAFENSGLSPLRMLVPYLVVAAGVAGVSYYLSGWFLPRHAGRMISFEAKYLKRPYYYREVNIHRQVAPGWFLYMEEYNVRDSIAYKMSLEKFEPSKALSYKASSSFARWSGVDSGWWLHDYRVRRFEGDRMEVAEGRRMLVRVPVTPRDFERHAMIFQLMTNADLERFITEFRLKGAREVRLAQVELAKRRALPAAAPILVIIAFAVASRRIRGGMGMHLGLGLLIGFSYIVFLHVAATAAVKADLPPQLGAWLPNIGYAVVAAVLMYRRQYG